jgi:hypothetical protein
METLTMSRKERERLTVMAGVTNQKLTLVQASELMRVCYRQSKRIWKRYQDDGDAGLVHRLRGQPSARRKPPALRRQVLALYAEARYADFGPTLMAEQLLKQKLVVDHETLRRWRLAEGTHTVRRRKQRHRQWRERKPSFGAMVQLVYRGQLLKWRRLPEGGVRKPAAAKPARKEQRKPGVKPPALNHPWRRDGVGLGRKYWNGVKASGRAARLGLRDSGQPPLRSGLPASRNPSRRNRAANNNRKRGHSLVSYDGDISKEF